MVLFQGNHVPNQVLYFTTLSCHRKSPLFPPYFPPISHFFIFNFLTHVISPPIDCSWVEEFVSLSRSFNHNSLDFCLHISSSPQTYSSSFSLRLTSVSTYVGLASSFLYAFKFKSDFRYNFLYFPETKFVPSSEILRCMVWSLFFVEVHDFHTWGHGPMPQLYFLYWLLTRNGHKPFKRCNPLVFTFMDLTFGLILIVIICES